MSNTIETHPRSLVIPYNPQQEQETKKRLEECLSHVMDNVPNSIVENIKDIYQEILLKGDKDPQYLENNIPRRKKRSVKKKFCLTMKDFLKKHGVKGQWIRGNRKGILNLTIEKLWEILIIERDIRLKYLETCLKEYEQELHGPTKSDLENAQKSSSKLVALLGEANSPEENDSIFADFLADPNVVFSQDFSSMPHYKNKARHDEMYADIYKNEKEHRKKTKGELRNIQQQINFLEKLPKKINVTDDSFIERRKLPVIQNSPKCRASS